MMLFHDAAGERKAKSGAISLGGEERPEDIGQVSRGDTGGSKGNRGRLHKLEARKSECLLVKRQRASTSCARSELCDQRVRE